jgi:NADH dehydrogenase
VIPTATVVLCTGLRASPIAELLPVARDQWGRLPVNSHLKVEALDGVFAAGDVAVAKVDDENVSMMSCQHSRPMGKFAGHNVVCDLLGLPMLPLRTSLYVTVLDLGTQGAVYTQGWDRRLVSQGNAAKRTKTVINTERVYPPLTGDMAEILAAGAPEVHPPPAR